MAILNTKCPMCGKWHYKKNADPKVKRNFCNKCLAFIGSSDESTDGNEIYNCSPTYIKEEKK